MTTTTIDLAPVLTPLIQIAGIALAGVVTWLAGRAATYFHVSTQNALLQRVVDIADRGIAYGQQVVTEKVAAGAKVDVKNAVLAEATNYVLTKAPDAVASLGMTNQHVADMVLAKLPAAAAP